MDTIKNRIDWGKSFLMRSTANLHIKVVLELLVHNDVQARAIMKPVLDTYIPQNFHFINNPSGTLYFFILDTEPLMTNPLLNQFVSKMMGIERRFYRDLTVDPGCMFSAIHPTHQMEPWLETPYNLINGVLMRNPNYAAF